jgi:osmotically inducible protein OsmC
LPDLIFPGGRSLHRPGTEAAGALVMNRRPGLSYGQLVFLYQSTRLEELHMKIKRRGSAKWSGGIKDGKGAISTESGALKDYPYGFASRFEGKPGTNPEELLGAAHAGCFTMALSLILGEAKLTATQMDTTAEVALEQVEGGYAITSVHLTLRAKVPGADQATFAQLAAKAKAGCPVSKLFKTEITLDAALLS